MQVQRSRNRRQGRKRQRRPKPPQEDKNLAKRQKVVDLYEQGETSLRAIASKLKVNRAFATSVIKRWTTFRTVQQGTRAAAKQKKVEKVLKVIRERKNPYQTITDIQRTVRMTGVAVGKKLVSTCLRSQGLRWGEPLKPSKLKPLDEEKKDMLMDIAQTIESSLTDDDRQVVFVDEIKFPLVQVPKKVWRARGEFIPDRPAEPITITCAAACNYQGFVAVQFFYQELKGADFAYFMTEVDKYVSKMRTKTIYLMDQAPWHTGATADFGDLRESIMFNIPGWPELNMIETTFSKVREKYRKRPIFRSREEEIRNLVEIFNNCNEEEEFAGYTRNLVRTLISKLRGLNYNRN